MNAIERAREAKKAKEKEQAEESARHKEFIQGLKKKADELFAPIEKEFKKLSGESVKEGWTLEYSPKDKKLYALKKNWKVVLVKVSVGVDTHYDNRSEYYSGDREPPSYSASVVMTQYRLPLFEPDDEEGSYKNSFYFTYHSDYRETRDNPPTPKEAGELLSEILQEYV